MPRFYVLGSNGGLATPQRQTCSHLLETRRSLILFDCGAGLSRLFDPLFQVMLKRHTRVIVLAAGYEQERLEGLRYLAEFCGHMKVALVLPPSPEEGATAEDLLGRFGGKPFLSDPLPRWEHRFEGGWSIHEAKEGLNRVLGEKIEVLPVAGASPRCLYRVRDVTYAVGAGPRAETVALARRSGLLVHDAWWDAAGQPKGPAAGRDHATAREAASMALQASVTDLVLAELNPGYDPVRLERLLFEATAVFPRSFLGSDMMVVEVRSQEAEEEEEESEELEAPSATDDAVEEPEAGSPRAESSDASADEPAHPEGVLRTAIDSQEES